MLICSGQQYELRKHIVYPHGVFYTLFGVLVLGFLETLVRSLGVIFVETMLWVFMGQAQHRVDRPDPLVWSGQATLVVNPVSTDILSMHS